MRKWTPLTAVCLGTFMLLVDITIVTVALPQMAVGLSASFSSLQWVIDSYTLTLAALLLGLGSAADRYGRRRVYLAGLTVFALASAASGLATSTGVLIAARAVQGVGGAAMYATTIALLNSCYRGRDRGVAFGIWGAVSGAAAAAGPILGGVLTQDLSWRWIFFVNLPVSAVAIAMTWRAFTSDGTPASGPAAAASTVAVTPGAPGQPAAGPTAPSATPSAGTRPTALDVPGMITFTAGAAAATYGLIRAAASGWGRPLTVALLAGAVLAFVIFGLVERKVSTPLLDPALLRRPAFTGVLAAGLLLNAAAFAYLPYTSLWLQTVLRLSPIRAGLEGSAPMSLAAFVVSALIGRFLHDISPRWVVGGGLALIGAGAIAQATLTAHASGLHLLPGLIVAGIGVGLATPALVSNAMAAVPQHQGGMAAGAVNTARQLGFTFGIAVIGSMFAARATASLPSPHLRALGPAISAGQAQAALAHQPAAGRAATTAAVHAATATGLNAALLLAGVLGLAGALVAALTLRRPPAHPPGAPAGPAQVPGTATAEGPAPVPAASRTDLRNNAR